MELRQSNEAGRSLALSESATDAGLRPFMLGVYGKLALGLGLAGAVAWVVGNVPPVSRLMFRTIAGEVVGYTPIGLAVAFARNVTSGLKLVYQEAAADRASLATATNYGALTLFINFINLFQFLLSLTGERRR